MMEELATLTEEKKKTIQNYAQETLSITMQFDHIGDFFFSETYNNSKVILSSVISDAVTKKYQAGFHQKLTHMEKANYISQQKRIRYEKNCEMIQKGTNIGIRTVMDGLPLLYQCLENTINQNNAEKFILSWMGYINQGNEVTPIMKSNARVIFDAMGLKYNAEGLNAILLNASKISAEKLPKLNKKNRYSFNMAEKDILLTLAKMIIASADLQESQTRERSMEFISDLFDIAHSEAESKIKDIMAAQQHLTHLLIFSAIDYMTFFNHFISSVEEAGRFGGYDINMDAYAQLRQRNQGKVNKIGVDIGKIGVQAVKAGISRNIGNLFKCVAPTIDILKISEEMMNDTLTPSKSRAWEFLDAMIEHRETYNLSMEDK
ncbi:MAG: hypothetical protein OSJ61_08810 [Lachnospiraceae bacterium]|nr:hypothetical protein [Lachnospiraceae bacterium]